MNEIFGPNNKVLEVDLSTQSFKIYNVTPKERKMFLGGKGLGLKLIYDRMKPGIDPYGPDNILAFMPGVMMGTGAPCSGRFSGVTKSPLTGIMVCASCGGPFGMNLKTAGWDGLLVSGISEYPVYLEISAKGIEFKNAKDIWGLDTATAQKKLGDKKAGALVIGPAGENLVKFSNIASGERFLGRGGMGAVMGAKKLKAIIAKGGEFKIKPMRQELFDSIKMTATQYINRNSVTSGLYRNYGTGGTVDLSMKNKILPVNNFLTGEHEKGLELSGKKMADQYQTKHHTCRPCTILCGKKGTFDDKEMVVPEFETIGMMGSNLGIFDSMKVAEWNKICGDFGIDTISAGGTLAWVMEAGAKGLIQTDLKFGQTEGITEALHDITYRNGFGNEMAEGSRWLSEKYGGKEFAIQVKGMEIAAYDPRGSFGQGLAYAVANRGGCHLSAYIVALEVFSRALLPFTTAAKPEFVKLFESLNCCINSLVTCQFTTYAYLLEPPLSKYTPEIVLGSLMQFLPKIAVNLLDFSLYKDFWSAVTGIEISNSDFLMAGDRIHTLERYMNTREGISRKDDTLPGRFLNEWRVCDPKKRTVPLDKMLDNYYELRGYNMNGIPTKQTLYKYGLI